MKKSMKILSLALAVVLVFSCGIGATLAYLSYNGGTVTNTFVSGDILKPQPEGEKAFYLTEHKSVKQADGSYAIDSTAPTTQGNGYEVIPATTLQKDPFVHVELQADAYLFVEVVDNLPTGMTHSVNDAVWTKTSLSGHKGGDVYVLKANEGKLAADTNKDFSILTGNKIDVTPEFDVAGVENSKNVNLTCYAYLVQAAGLANYTLAWDETVAY